MPAPSPIPSIKTLRQVFADRAPEARRILEMSRAELETLPAGAARVRACYHPPSTADLRLHCLSALDPGLCGVEGFPLTRGRYAGEWLEYINAGDTYTPTIVRVCGRYRVACWGDYAERYTR